MTGRPGPGPAGPPAPVDDDAGRWAEAARLRREHPGWAIVWLSPIGQFRAYARLPGTRRDTALTAPTAAGLAGLISRAGQAAPGPARPREPA